MKYIDEFRDSSLALSLVKAIHQTVTRSWKLMEVCGGQTHAIIKHGLDTLISPGVTLVHGPGCPVCVTPASLIDRSIELAARKNFIICSFGDMLRVPGSSGDLLSTKAQGGDVRIVYSPRDAVTIAIENPAKEVVFLAVGFETTVPTAAATLAIAIMANVTNYSLLSAHFLVPPALEALLDHPACTVQAFLAPGHVCTVTGYAAYEDLASRRSVPIVVTGFEPVDILQGILMAVKQLEAGTYIVENQYSRAVKREGSVAALSLIDEYFEVADQQWRGLGVIPSSGLKIKSRFSSFDAIARFGLDDSSEVTRSECISGDVLRGLRRPYECPAFAGLCTPEHPLGAPMVSSEGPCAAYHRYRAS